MVSFTIFTASVPKILDHVYHWILFRMRNVGDKFVEKIKTHILCSLTLTRTHAVYELMWKTFVEPERLHMIV